MRRYLAAEIETPKGTVVVYPLQPGKLNRGYQARHQATGERRLLTSTAAVKAAEA